MVFIASNFYDIFIVFVVFEALFKKFVFKAYHICRDLKPRIFLIFGWNNIEFFYDKLLKLSKCKITNGLVRYGFLSICPVGILVI